jgi:hypothetical protein
VRISDHDQSDAFFVEPPRQRKEARLQLFKLSGNAPSLTNILGDCASPTAVILKGPAAGAAVFTKDGGETGITCLQINVGALGTGISAVTPCCKCCAYSFWSCGHELAAPQVCRCQRGAAACAVS